MEVHIHEELRSGGNNTHQLWRHGDIGRDNLHNNVGDVVIPGRVPPSCHVHTPILSGADVHSTLINTTSIIKPHSSENYGRRVNHARRKAILRGNGRAGFLVVANDHGEEQKLATDAICFSEPSPNDGPSIPLFNGNHLSDKWAHSEGLQKGAALGLAKAGAIADEKQHRIQRQESNRQQNSPSSGPLPKQHQPTGWPSSDFPPNESSSSQPHEHTTQDMVSCTASIDSAQFAVQGKSLLQFLEDGSAVYAGFGSSLSVHQPGQATPQYDAQLALERVSLAPVPFLQDGFHGQPFEDFDDGFAPGLWAGHAQQGSLMDHMQVDGSQTHAGHESELFAIAAQPGSTYMAMVTGEKEDGAADSVPRTLLMPFNGKGNIAVGDGGDDDDPRKAEVELEAKSVPDMSFILEAAQELLMEVCRCPKPSRKWRRRHDSSNLGDGMGQRPSPASSSISGVIGQGQLQTIPVGGTREQAQRLRALLVDVEKSYGKYKEQNKTLAAAFDAATGTEGSANMYTKPSLHAISTAFRSAKDGIEANLQRLAN